MVNLYATLIINKRRTFDQVPEKFKADVEAKLAGSLLCSGLPRLIKRGLG